MNHIIFANIQEEKIVPIRKKIMAVSIKAQIEAETEALYEDMITTFKNGFDEKLIRAICRSTAIKTINEGKL